MAEGEADRTVMFVVVTEADYGGTYSLVLGGVYGPYATESDAEQALDVAGFQEKHGKWSKPGGWSGISGAVIELEPLTKESR